MGHSQRIRSVVGIDEAKEELKSEAKSDEVKAKLERARCMLKSIHADGYNDHSHSGRLSSDERNLIDLIRLLEE